MDTWVSKKLDLSAPLSVGHSGKTESTRSVKRTNEIVDVCNPNENISTTTNLTYGESYKERNLRIDKSRPSKPPKDTIVTEKDKNPNVITNGIVKPANGMRIKGRGPTSWGCLFRIVQSHVVWHSGTFFPKEWMWTISGTTRATGY